MSDLLYIWFKLSLLLSGCYSRGEFAGVKMKEELAVFWPYPKCWKECSVYFYITRWNHAGYTAPLVAPMKAGVM